MLPRVPTNLCSCLDKIHATTHAPTAELQLSRDTVSINPSLTLRSVVFEDGHRNTGSVSLTPSSILSSNNNGLAREFFKHLPSSVWFRAMCTSYYNCCSLSERSALSNLLSGVRDERCHWIGWLRPRAFHLPPSTFPSLPPFHVPPSPAFHVILDFPSFLPPGAANNIQILGNSCDNPWMSGETKYDVTQNVTIQWEIAWNMTVDSWRISNGHGNDCSGNHGKGVKYGKEKLQRTFNSTDKWLSKKNTFAV